MMFQTSQQSSSEHVSEGVLMLLQKELLEEQRHCMGADVSADHEQKMEDLEVKITAKTKQLRGASQRARKRKEDLNIDADDSESRVVSAVAADTRGSRPEVGVVCGERCGMEAWICSNVLARSKS